MKKSIIFLLCILPLFCAAQPGYINTIAGSGSSGFSGDGGSALLATMGQALGHICIDGSGNVFFTDDDNYRIRKVTPAGVISTIAGGGSSTADGIPATSASLSLNAAGTMAIDIHGDLFFSDGNRIRKLTMTTGIINNIAGTDSSGYSGDGGPATAAELSYPVGIFVDASGNIYVGDETNRRVRKINSSGIISTYAGTGTAGFSGDGGPATAANMQSPDGLCLDAAGNLYVADRYNYRIRKISTSGIISTVAGSGSSGYCGDGGPATAACFFEPSSVSMDSYGSLYISDFHNGRVRKVDPSGIVSTYAGGGSSSGTGVPATAASLTDVWGIGIDNYDNIYISDRNNYRICKVGVGVPTVTSDSFSIVISNSCTGINFQIVTNSFSTTQHVKTYLGNGMIVDTAVSAYGSRGFCSLFNSYSTGIYTIKHVLFDGLLAVDSITYIRNFSACQSFTVKNYFDANANCVKDGTEPYFFQSIKTEVDSDGAPIDTVVSTSGFNYLAYGSSGSVYSFKVISTPAGVHVSCPSSGVIRDTMLTGIQTVKSFGLVCDTTGVFDLAMHAITVVSGVRDQWGHIYVSNSYCYAPSSTVTMHYSPIYTFSNATPTQTSTYANAVTWNIDTLSAHVNRPVDIIWGLDPVYAGSAVPGDTTHTTYAITPFIGDGDTANNTQVIIDTVRAGCDPNEIWVSPDGCINSSGGPLQYTIHFENTGNDTAFNIYVLDTLSASVDLSTINILMSSAEMYTSKLSGPMGQTILKFDFPNINLLDSSHHGLCDGAVIFTVNSKPGLAYTTRIDNRAGIYFDYNTVVSTNQVETIIGCPSLDVNNIPPNDNPVIYPNPASDVLTIEVDKAFFDSYTITNSIGKTVLTNKLTQAQTQIAINGLPAGFYFVNIKGAQGTIVRKFVKE
jgi:uncharacterized repeat protein (TIGR01451 family)